MTPGSIRTAACAVIAMLTLALAPGALAANEVGDAGDLRVTANDMGDSAVTEISGTLLDASDADLYRICLSDGASFSATHGRLDGARHAAVPLRRRGIRRVRERRLGDARLEPSREPPLLASHGWRVLPRDQPVQPRPAELPGRDLPGQLQPDCLPGRRAVRERVRRLRDAQQLGWSPGREAGLLPHQAHGHGHMRAARHDEADGPDHEPGRRLEGAAGRRRHG